MHGFVFMTLVTLRSLRATGEVESEREQMASRVRGRPPFAHYQGRCVITVPKGMAKDGEVLDSPTPEIAAWVRKRSWWKDTLVAAE